MLGGFTRSLSALVHFTLHTGAGVDSVVYILGKHPRRFKKIVLHGEILPPKPWGSIRGVVPDTPTKRRGASTPSLLARGPPVYDPGIVKI